MEDWRFDAWTRRRFGLATGGAIAAVLGLKAAGFPGGAAAKKRKKPQPNEFGCLNVGQACGGKDERCCSGICRGKKPKKGKKDASRCVAHDEQGCQAGQREQFCGGDNVECTTSTSTTPNGVCATTTGNAGYCAFTATCSPCSKDSDCRPVCGPGAACVRCANCIEDGGTRCVGIGPDACTFD